MAFNPEAKGDFVSHRGAWLPFIISGAAVDSRWGREGVGGLAGSVGVRFRSFFGRACKLTGAKAKVEPDGGALMWLSRGG